jgi:hypothetical protein
VTEEEEELSPIEEAYETVGMEEVAETAEEKEERFLLQRAPMVRIWEGKNKINVTAGRGKLVTGKPVWLRHLRPEAVWVSMDRKDVLLEGEASIRCSTEETKEGIHIRCSYPREVEVV